MTILHALKVFGKVVVVGVFGFCFGFAGVIFLLTKGVKIGR